MNLEAAKAEDLSGEMYRRLYMTEELEALKLSKADSRIVNTACEDLVKAAEYFYNHPVEKPSLSFITKEFDFIVKSGKVDIYVEKLVEFFKKACAIQLNNAIKGDTSQPLELITFLWKNLLRLVIFVHTHFCPQAFPDVDLRERLVGLAKTVFANQVLAYPLFRNISITHFENTVNVHKSAKALNQISPVFFTTYLQEIPLDYNKNVAEMAESSMHPRKYTQKIVQWLEDEMKAARKMDFTQGQLEHFKKFLYNTFVAGYLTGLLKKDNSFDIVLEHLDCAVFGVWFNLFNRVENGLDQLMALLTDYMTRKAQFFAEKRGKTEKSSLPTITIRDLISFKNVIDQVQTECCKGDSAFQSRIQSELHRVFTSVTKFAEFLVIYFDIELRQNKVDQIDNVLGLVHYVSNKDDFEKLYKIYLGRRLVAINGYNMDLEKVVIDSLKVEFGNAYTRKMEKMFADVATSADLVKEYGAQMGMVPESGALDLKSGLSFSINVITPGFWPQMNSLAPCRLSQKLASAFHSFETFYTTKYPTRKLGLIIYSGYVVIEARFYGPEAIEVTKRKIQQKDDAHHQNVGQFSSKKLVCTPVQCAILDLFNSCSYIDSNKVKSMGDNELRKGIPSLVRAKILVKEVVVDENNNEKEVFYVNDTFTHKKGTINLTKDSRADEAKNKKIDVAKINQACRNLVDAAVVRLMKLQKSMLHDELKQEVVAALDRPVEEKLFKKSIENLIDHHYLSRDTNNIKLYTYVE
ncbi:unnamed protein product [Bursaphelenchus okinawaensis]|uniref:Cullin family profile domain-containing protein n=1 Tax=Bursaphelenchus okinawaensis TaxID=465554 RepID=A0A811JSI0_9BILA|nr:unnamed protein product [Bursaphelenchus okinawaensis]CAG9080990.1 unnamed protein product [Bursaphelenchus okinawaensis]